MSTLPEAGEFRELLDAYCEGTITAEQSARLQACLLRDADLRRRFVFCVQVQAATERSLAALLRSGENAAISAAGADQAPAETKTASPPTPASPVLGFLGDVVSYVSNPRTVRFWLICAALATYFTVQIGSAIISHFRAKDAQIAGAGLGEGKASPPPSVAQDRPDPDDPTTLARLSGAVDCWWRIAGGEPVVLPVGTDFHSGQQLNLATGLAELTYASGAKLILHAPVRFALTTPLACDLQLGKLTAKVPHSAKGFTINTPSGKVVDLGTEFGVKVNDDRTTHVIVYVGEVEINSDAISGGSEQLASLHLKAGEASVVAPGQPAKRVLASDERFVRDLNAMDERAAAEAAYVEFVKKLKPALWLRMEGKEADRVLHDEASGRDFKLNWDGPGNPFVKGWIGKALWLRGDKLKDYALIPDYPKTEDGKLSFAAWVYAHNRTSSGSIAKNWASVHGQFYVGLHDRDHGSGADLYIQVQPQEGDAVAVREGDLHPLPTNEWQHVAFVADGSTLHVYRGGREVAKAKCAGVKFPVPLQALGIGVKPSDPGTGPNGGQPGYWDGLLDEIIICNDALSAEQVRTLAGAGN